jgi:AcrR family transcriptional regulator
MSGNVKAPARGRPPGNDGEARRALLAAARNEFAHRGYSGARTRTITEAAGVTPPALYHHFGSKAGLYAAVTEEVNDIVLAAFDEAIQGRTTVVERIDGLLDASIAVHAAEPSISEFVVAAPIDYARNPELAVLAPQMHRLRDYVRDRLAEPLSEPRVPTDPIVQVVLVLIFGVSRLAATATPREYRQAIEAVRSLVLGTLL